MPWTVPRFRFVALALALLCPFCSGCFFGGYFYPVVQFIPPTRVEPAAAAQVHAFRVDIIDSSDLMGGGAPYERLSFGPGQRYAAKGCYIVQLTHGANPALVKKSDWVIH